jgi:phosphomannomutase
VRAVVSVEERLLEAAAAWVADDPDPHTRAELTQLVQRARRDDAAARELADRFDGRLDCAGSSPPAPTG